MCPFDDEKDSAINWDVSAFYEDDKDKRAIQPLKGMLESGIPDLRLAAVEALSSIKSQEALDILKKLEQDDDENIRTAAKTAYENLKIMIKDYDDAFKKDRPKLERED